MTNSRNRFIVVASGMLFVASAMWSGWGMYMQYRYSDKTLAYVLGAGIVFLGIAVALILNHFAERQLQEDNSYFPTILMTFFSILWLTISPNYNAMTLTAKQALQSEIAEKLKDLYKKTDQLIKDDKVYSLDIVPKLISLHIYLKDSADAQIQIGGCGPICKSFQKLHRDLQEPINLLSTQFDKDNPSRPSLLISKELKNISNLTIDASSSINDLLIDFNESQSRITDEIDNIDSLTPPDDIAKVAINEINSLIMNLESKRSLYIKEPNSNIAKQATEFALSTLEPRYVSLDRLVDKLEVKNTNKNIYAKEKFTSIRGSLGTIQLNIPLIWKHANIYWNSMIMAYFIDILAISLVYLSVWTFLIMDYKGKKRASEIKTLIDKTNELKAELEDSEDDIKDYENEIDDLTNEIQDLDGERQKKISKVIDTIDDDNKPVLKSIDEELLAIIDEESEKLSENTVKEKEEIKACQNSERHAAINAMYYGFEESIKDEYKQKRAAKQEQKELLSSKRETRINEINEGFELEKENLYSKIRTLKDMMKNEKEEIKKYKFDLKETKKNIKLLSINLREALNSSNKLETSEKLKKLEEKDDIHKPFNEEIRDATSTLNGLSEKVDSFNRAKFQSQIKS